MAPWLDQTGKGIKDIRNGAVLQCLEAASLGMPFEVWKTRMGRFRNENTFTAFRYGTAHLLFSLFSLFEFLQVFRDRVEFVSSFGTS
mmetsp:Transcript_1558/g.3311  ORF Transcript_1558/g.3311 Transcript_1558/m.3311 type:complete len:87 (+) Transcript_1558:1271-1531(+)